MAEFVIVGSSGAFQLESQANYSLRTTHEGGQTVYYSTSPRVSSTINDGSLTTGQQFTFAGRRFFITQSGTGTQGSSASLRLDNVPVSGESVGTEAPINVETMFGADSTASDNTAAIQAAINALPHTGSGYSSARGGSILLPGRYKCASSLDLTDTYGVEFEGAGAPGSGYTPGASGLRYTGTGSSFIDARSSYGLHLRNIDVSYTSSSFTGNLVDFQHSASGNDSTYQLLEDCTMYGEGVATAKCLVSFQKAIIGEIRGGHYSWAQAAVRFREDLGGGNLGYSNAFSVNDVTFDNVTNALMNAGQVLAVKGCRFEGTNGGMGGLVHAYFDDISSDTALCYGVTFDDCWMGDAVAVTNWIDFGTKGAPHGLKVHGSFISGGTKGIVTAKGGHGLSVKGSSFGMTNAVDLGSSATGVWYGVDIGGNDFSGLTGTPVLNTSGHHGVRIQGNGPRNGENNPEDLVTITGHIGTDQARALAPSTAVQAAQAGAGATASIAGNDTAGTLTINTGTGAVAGLLCNINFAAAYDTAPTSGLSRPRVLLTPRTATASACQSYTTGGNTSQWSVYAGVNPTSSSTLIWDYFVIQ